MKAVCWNGKTDVIVEDVPDPQILNPRDAILRVTSTAICGSDLHLYGGFVPSMEKGDILGHEFMGEVVEAGSLGRPTSREGDRVVVPFAISCGHCFFCMRELWSLCDNSNPNAALAEKLNGFTDGRPLRILPPLRRIRRRAGPVRARPVRRRRALKVPRSSPTRRFSS